MGAMRATVLDADQLSPRELNQQLRELLAAEAEVVVENPRSRHNLGVALPGPGHVTFKGSVGYYCGGLNSGGSVEITRNAGWGIGESMARGFIRVRGSVGQSVGASLMGGTIVVEGDAGPRAGVAQKGGVVLVGGDIGFLSGFMAQRGKLIVLGNAADGVGDSLYEGNIYVAGRILGLGIDAVVVQPEAAEIDEIEAIIAEAGFPSRLREWKKVVAGRKLWYFDKREAQTWLKV
ncbi:MAG TPA: glutamate synthase [Chloroflexi bacterium]|nr:glutamate synthase [Chloroflexota bacterium]